MRKQRRISREQRIANGVQAARQAAHSSQSVSASQTTFSDIPESKQTRRIKETAAKDAARAARKAQSKAAYNSTSSMEEFININSEIRNKIFQTNHAKPQRTRKARKGDF